MDFMSSSPLPSVGMDQTTFSTSETARDLGSELETGFSSYQASVPVTATTQCLPQRAALLKSMLNFLKKAIQDTAFSDSIRQGECLVYESFALCKNQ